MDMPDLELDKAKLVEKLDEFYQKINCIDVLENNTISLINLKRLNRLIQIRCKNIKDKTNDVKINVDKNYLLLQNLLYQVNYLKQEIDFCLNYPSCHEELDIIPWDIFLANNIEFGSSEKLISANMKLLNKDELSALYNVTTARLKWELTERKNLMTIIGDLQNSKAQLLSANSDKLKKIHSIVPALKNVMEASLPLQAHFNLDISKFGNVMKIIDSLPLPLINLFIQFNTWVQHSKSKINIVRIEHYQDNVSLSQNVDTLVNELLNQNSTDISDNFEKLVFLIKNELSESHTLQLNMEIQDLNYFLVSNIYYFPKINLNTLKVDLKPKVSSVESNDIMKSIEFQRFSDCLLTQLLLKSVPISSPTTQWLMKLQMNSGIGESNISNLNHMIPMIYNKIGVPINTHITFNDLQILSCQLVSFQDFSQGLDELLTYIQPALHLLSLIFGLRHILSKQTNNNEFNSLFSLMKGVNINIDCDVLQFVLEFVLVIKDQEYTLIIMFPVFESLAHLFCHEKTPNKLVDKPSYPKISIKFHQTHHDIETNPNNEITFNIHDVSNNLANFVNNLNVGTQNGIQNHCHLIKLLHDLFYEILLPLTTNDPNHEKINNGDDDDNVLKSAFLFLRNLDVKVYEDIIFLFKLENEITKDVSEN